MTFATVALAKSIALTVALGAFIEVLAVWRPGAGLLDRHPLVSVVSSAVGLGVAALVIALMVTAPIVHGVGGLEGWSATFVTYFLASNNRIFGGPYAFTWTAPWMYPVGSLAPLVAVGGLLALVSGHYAPPAYRRASIACMIAGACLLVAFTAGGIYAIWVVRDGMPV